MKIIDKLTTTNMDSDQQTDKKMPKTVDHQKVI